MAAGGKAKVVLVSTGKSKPSKWAIGALKCGAKSAGRSGKTALLTVSCTMKPSGGGQQQGGGTTPGGDNTTPPPGGGNTTPPAADNWFRFAPYTDMTLGAPVLPADLKAAGFGHATLAFVLASGGDQCVPDLGRVRR